MKRLGYSPFTNETECVTCVVMKNKKLDKARDEGAANDRTKYSAYRVAQYSAYRGEGFLEGSNHMRKLHEPLVEAVKASLWVGNCLCDEAYTSRRRHAPNAYCGELDEVKQALIDTGYLDD